MPQHANPRIDELLGRLDALLSQEQPDAVCLNEVISLDTKGVRSLVISRLGKHGYKVRFTKFSNMDDQHLVGSGMGVKGSVTYRDIELGRDVDAHKRGYPKQKVYAIAGKINTRAGYFYLITAYLANLVPHNWREHWRQQKRLSRHIERLKTKDVALVGDLNEFKYMPGSLYRRLHRRFERHTGTLVRPTWRLLGKRWTLVRANYDQFLIDRGSNFEVSSFKVLEQNLSDHMPLLINLKTRQRYNNDARS